jgi:cytoskeletal protein CcmA (bactofilin family)
MVLAHAASSGLHFRVGDNAVSKSNGQAVIGPDLFIKGDVRNGRSVEVLGQIDGSLTAEHVIVHKGGRIYGALVVDNAQIDGEVQGHLLVRQLLQIGSTGSVHGDVRYGRLAMQAGAELSADVRNVPPAIAGDLNLAVRRGQSVRITTEDLTAIDPDSPAESLVFTVTRPLNGFVARALEAGTPIERFSQPELQRNGLVFVHDGSPGDAASFEVAVTDQTGASSGPPNTVRVAVFK